MHAEAAPGLVYGAAVNNGPCAVADLLTGLPGEDNLAGEAIPVFAQHTGRADERGIVPVVPAGVHFARSEALVFRRVFLRNGQGVDIRPQYDAARRTVCRGCAFDLGIDAGARNAAVLDAELVKLPLDDFLGLDFLFGKFRVLMEPAAKGDDIIVIPEHLVI